MRSGIRIRIGAALVVFMLLTWFVAVSSQTASQKQYALITQAVNLINDGIYIRAVPLLEEAVGLNAIYTDTAEESLKYAYLALSDTRGFSRKYTALLDRQISRRDAGADIFAEAANYYLSKSRVTEALDILKAGMDRTGDDGLYALYESNRYAYETIRTSYSRISAIHAGFVRVEKDGLVGIARSDGTILIPCQYEKVSTFGVDRAIVLHDGVAFAVDRNNNRIAISREAVNDIGNLSENRIALNIDGAWQRASADLTMGTASFEYIGTYSGGYAAAKIEGRWGVVDIGTNWLVPPEYDDVIMDELGRCYGQGALFVRLGEQVYLFSHGQLDRTPFENARPFSDEGYAAVSRNGKWGFIDTGGNIVIDLIYDDALSFGQHLAAVKIGDVWGYISIYGEVVIEPKFIEAKSFSHGMAPVLAERGWQILRLKEYK